PRARPATLPGQNSHKNGVYTLADPIDPKRPHLAHLLQRAGYQTAIFGKWHLHTDPTGFDHWNILPGQGRYPNPILFTKDGKKEYEGYSEDVITSLTIEWMKKRDKSKPFMALCHFNAPHRPWAPARRLADRYKNETRPEPPTLQDDLKGRSKAVAATKMTVGEHMVERDLQMKIPKDLPREKLRQWAYQQYMKRYLACVAAV